MADIFLLPNKQLLTISDNVLSNIEKFKQLGKSSEAGGFLLGRTTIKGNTNILDLTLPQPKDFRDLYNFIRKDKNHLTILNDSHKKCLYFKGNWHTHPQKIPKPSIIDIVGWNMNLQKAKAGRSNYMIFLIMGDDDYCVWVGSSKSKKIVKLEKLERNND